MSIDMINHPPHYAGGKVECIEFAEQLGFCMGNAFKYVWRSGKKGGAEKEIEDLQKALWYVRRAKKQKKQNIDWISMPTEIYDEMNGFQLEKFNILLMIAGGMARQKYLEMSIEKLIDRIKNTPDWREESSK